MKILKTLWVLIALTSLTLAAAEEKDKGKEAGSKTGDKEKAAADPEAVFRKPFTLKLYVDKEHFYEEKFGEIPYVHSGNVYLFKDDELGLRLEMKGEVISKVKYEPDLTKADVTLKFSQKVSAEGTAMMLLHLHNNTKQTLNFDALMTTPGRKGIAKTSILPLLPGLSGFESWPHPIVQLVLQDIRIGKEK
ncbi:MAG: hypothetical protein ACAI34_07130 [Verrucomicrobium sp.]|nr:hypothetical protein [Verrucomicrobium sp.]